MSGPGPERLIRTPWRLEADEDDLGKGLGRLLVALLEIVRELLERQAVRRAESGSLSPDEVERLGRALIALKDQLADLREHLCVEDGDTPLPGHLLDDLLAEHPDTAGELRGRSTS